MFSIKTPSVTSSRTRESRVFLPLHRGVHPFPIKRSPVHLPPIFAKPKCDLEEEQDLIPLSKPKPISNLAGMVAGITSMFRRHRNVRISVDAAKSEPIWFTSPDNWRPGLVTLEQAASREDIVRRPEAFERI